jgi:hypothetical protein
VRNIEIHDAKTNTGCAKSARAKTEIGFNTTPLFWLVHPEKVYLSVLTSTNLVLVDYFVEINRARGLMHK